ncbi:MAG: glucose-6-phosphate isomerase [Flammeovirgaceae bacterium]|nr:glucose-6-phosphate isomerase [Flammeovirgaceae bacterium]
MSLIKNNNPTQTKSWKELDQHFNEIKEQSLIDLFKKESNRLAYLSFDEGNFYFDFSKNHLTKKTLSLFASLANEMGLIEAKKTLFEGQKINKTEDRAVLHTALRNLKNKPIILDGESLMPLVFAELYKMKDFSTKLREGQHLGYTSKRIENIVNIGIGGSDLGPKMVCEALKPYWVKGITPHFISNVDASHIDPLLQKLNPETTLFIIASKTFTTQETMTNAMTARNWFIKHASEKEIAKHFVAVSTNSQKVSEFGIDLQNMFKFWDWVGGRYSLWSSIGLSIVCTIGYDHFIDLLKGAEKMDEHFLNSPLESNAPTLMAFIGIWYNNFFKTQTQAILPYDQRLAYFSKYLQQADMESNGKSTDRNGDKIKYETGQIIWGEPGTNGQHAFYQLIHQGTKIIPCDFIAAALPAHNKTDHHDKLVANFIAQTEALMKGKDILTIKSELGQKNISNEEIKALLPFKVFEGNRPTSTLLMDKLTPENLGSLIALYEHKIFVQGFIWNVFSFDQWGVELGKQLADNILTEIKTGDLQESHDFSTQKIIKKYLSHKNKF